MKSKTKKGVPMATTVKTESYIVLPFANLLIDNTWNVRSSLETGEGGPDGEGGFAGLKKSIAAKGQDEPVIVRPNPTKSRHEFALVTGFRRVEAIRQIAEESGNKEPTVKAIVRHMSEQAARELNLRENTARDSLSGPDLAFGVKTLLELQPDLTQVAMADMLGMSQPYIGKLQRIIEKVTPKLTKDWRDSTLKLTVDQMASLVSVPKDEQTEKYEEMLRGKENGSARGKNAWVETCVKAAEKAGKLFGALVRDGHITIDSEDFFGECLDTLITVNTKATDKQRQKISDAAEKAYQVEVERDIEAETKAAKAEADAKATKAAKANTKKNSAEANAN